MKKILLFAAFILAAGSSCQEEIESVAPKTAVSTDAEGPVAGQVIRTRAAFTPSDVLTQLAQQRIPFNIKSAYPSHRNAYLCARRDNSAPIAGQGHDDGSGRQRWILGYEENLYGGYIIKSYGGISNAANCYLRFIKNSFYMNAPAPFLSGSTSFLYPNKVALRPTDDDSNYSIGGWEAPLGSTIPIDNRLSLKDNTGNAIIKTEKSLSAPLTLLEQWQIIPLEDYEILDICYDFLAGDTFTARPIEVRRLPVINDTNVPATRTFTISGTVTNKSKRSKTHKLTVTVKRSADVKWKIPLFADGGMSIDKTTTNEWAWGEETEYTKTETISQTLTQEIPAWTTITATIIGTEYTADITYYAKIRGLKTGTILWVPGKWHGVMVNETAVKLSYPDGQVLRTVGIN